MAARSTSKSAPVQATPDVASIVQAVLAAMGQTDAPAATPKATPKAKSQPKATPAKAKEPRTISDPTRHASNRQVWLLAARLFQAHYGDPMPKPLTMGDVQMILDDLA